MARGKKKVVQDKKKCPFCGGDGCMHCRYTGNKITELNWKQYRKQKREKAGV